MLPKMSLKLVFYLNLLERMIKIFMEVQKLKNLKKCVVIILMLITLLQLIHGHLV